MKILLLLSLFTIVATAAKSLHAQTTAPSTAPSEVIHLWPGDAPLAKGHADEDVPTLGVYLPAKEQANGCAVVICPGGAYVHLSMVKEGSDVANWLKDHGIAAFVLKYRIKPYGQPAPMLDGQRAIRLVRSRAAEWNIDPARIGMLGFSAGGHVASTVGTHFDAGNATAPDPIDRQSCRPDFLLLLYPVISMNAQIAHGGSRTQLLGENPSDDLVRLYSNELQVTDQTPPTFIAHSKPDKTVKIANSERFYEALQQHHVPSELIELETGGHGWGLAPKNPELSVWKEKCLAWMASQHLLEKR
jgi:acetyl esterase/lipase